MTMPDECRPPPNTPDGTVCVLRHNRRKRNNWVYLRWRVVECWDTPLHRAMSPLLLHKLGWRYHSIAEPPGDGPEINQ